MRTTARNLVVVSTCCICLACAFGTALTVGHAAELRAGVARVDLTPPLELNAPLGGYGERMNRPAEGVHDRIFAKAWSSLMADRKFALVTVDIVGLSADVEAGADRAAWCRLVDGPGHAAAQPFAYQHRDERHQPAQYFSGSATGHL